MIKRCFYVSGFHKKKDFATDRVLDLDATYAVIKETAEAAGLECIRADEIRHSGTIDVPMFRELLEADLVIADLSTSNVNAAYELSVRHALRPRRTIIIAEKGFLAPFDTSHLVIWRYTHIGEDIGYAEVKRIKRELGQHISELMAKDEPDSPVYLFLPGLAPPAKGTVESFGAIAESEEAVAESTETVAMLLGLAMKAKSRGEFSSAEELLKKVVGDQPSDDYLRQQLALVTYKSKLPDEISALKRANEVLAPLHPEATVDTETVGLWAAIQKRLWEQKPESRYLDTAIRGLEKIYALKTDWYNGINLAFLLAARSATEGAQDAESDAMQAGVVWRRVLRACTAEYEERVKNKEFDVSADERDEKLREEQYWLLATLREACVGLGDSDTAEAWALQAAGTAPHGWMLDTTEKQVAKPTAFLSRGASAGSE